MNHRANRVSKALQLFIASSFSCFSLSTFAATAYPKELLSVYSEDRAPMPERRFKAITRTALNRFPLDYGDPSPPQLNCEGDLVITTTGGFQLKWARATSEDAWRAFLRGERPEIERLLFHHNLSTPLEEKFGEDVWDPVLYCFHGEGLIIGSMMLPQPGNANARWPEDHWSRRTYLYREQNGAWIPEQKPMFTPHPRHKDWKYHNYGHGLLVSDSGAGRIFYERVTEERDGIPYKTEIFSQQVRDFIVSSGKEERVLAISEALKKSAKRSDGAYLIEGPRPFLFNGQTGISFSAGDYNSDHYGIHLIWEARPGEFKPVVDHKGNLFDFGQNIRKRPPMTWGPARAAFFEHDGQWWVIFHGVPIDSEYDREEARRDIFIAPVRITAGPQPKIEILVEMP